MRGPISSGHLPVGSAQAFLRKALWVTLGFHLSSAVKSVDEAPVEGTGAALHVPGLVGSVSFTSPHSQGSPEPSLFTALVTAKPQVQKSQRKKVSPSQWEWSKASPGRV